MPYSLRYSSDRSFIESALADSFYKDKTLTEVYHLIARQYHG